jgi:lysine 6-dehydrogenase
MKLLVLGSGLMGPAAAFNAMTDPQVSQVTICDASGDQLQAARSRLENMPGADKLSTVQLDLSDQAAAARLGADFDVILAALPHAAIPLGIRAAVAAGKPLVDLSWPPPEQLPELIQLVAEAGILVIPGCGLEPGLTEIMTRYLAEKLDSVDEVHIKCGGIPEVPRPPLGYKIVFGGRRLPLREAEARIAENGSLVPVPRYSGLELVSFPGVGECEAWHEGFMPWLLELDALRGLKHGTQKTIRWPGYAAKINVLKDVGLLSTQPIQVDGTTVVPKQVLDALLYPKVKMEPNDRDITLFRVDVAGRKNGWVRRYRIQMIDRYDESLGFTSMARTTAMTGAIVARMVGRGEIQGQGWTTPEKLITGAHFDRLVAELAEIGVHFEITTEEAGKLAASS